MDLSVREKIYQVIFGTNTPAGRNFDIILIITILISVGAIILDSIESIHLSYGTELRYIEWFFTFVFTAEYLVRLYCSPKPWHYSHLS